jgi:hypothetical protein
VTVRRESGDLSGASEGDMNGVIKCDDAFNRMLHNTLLRIFYF